MSNPTTDQDLKRFGQLTLTAWELEHALDNVEPDPELEVQPPRPARAGSMALRAHARLQGEMETRLGVPKDRRTRIGIQPEVGESVLLVHGSTGTPQDLDGLARFLYGQGYTVYNMLLPGHGLESTTLPVVKWKACLNEVQLRYRLLARHSRLVHVVGFSFGGALAILLTRQEQPASLSLLAPALVPRVPLGTRLLMLLGLHRLPLLRRRIGWNLEVFEAMERAKSQVGKLRLPIYAAHCQDDARIDPASLRLLQKRTRHRASRFRLFKTGGHMILAAHGETALNDALLQFLRDRH